MKTIFLMAITFYQKCISAFLGPRCRFYPSCSCYSKECFESFPVYKALWYSIVRISRCHPFSSGGWDPIPSPDKQNH